MEDLCGLLVGAITVLPNIATFITSRWLNGLPWWENLPDDRKAEIHFAASVLIGGLIGLAAYLIECPDFPGWVPWLLAAVVSAWNYFIGKAIRKAWRLENGGE